MKKESIETFSLIPPPPPNTYEDKRDIMDERKFSDYNGAFVYEDPEVKQGGKQDHWSTSKDGKLVAKASIFLHKMLYSSSSEGGLLEFIEENCKLFENLDDGEFLLHHYDIYREYQSKIDRVLDDFAVQENCGHQEMLQSFQRASEQTSKADKCIQLILGRASYPKFVRLMKTKAAELRSREETSELKSREEVKVAYRQR